jgi:hypothetical protein
MPRTAKESEITCDSETFKKFDDRRNFPTSLLSHDPSTHSTQFIRCWFVVLNRKHRNVFAIP